MPPSYEFFCKLCGHIKLQLSRDKPQCVHCGFVMTRKWGFNYKPPMTEHFNNSVGQVVSSDRQFDDALKRKAEEQSKQTGMTTNYVRVDPTDTTHLKVNQDNLEKTKKKDRDSGLTTPKERTFI